jgi:hypothetical protein
MNLRNMVPADGAALALACGTFLETVAELLDDPEVEDVHVVLEHRPPTFKVLILGVAGERVVAHHELGVASVLPDRVKLRLLLMYVEALQEANRKWIIKMNPKLVEVGANPLSVPRAGSS